MKINQNSKRKYVKPAFTTIELLHHSHLLQTSATRTGYGDAIEEEWP